MTGSPESYASEPVRHHHPRSDELVLEGTLVIDLEGGTGELAAETVFVDSDAR